MRWAGGDGRPVKRGGVSCGGGGAARDHSLLPDIAICSFVDASFSVQERSLRLP